MKGADVVRDGRLSELFVGATSADPAERERAMAEAVREDLGDALSILLSADERNDDGFLSEPLIETMSGAVDSPAVLEPGAMLGRCRVRKELFLGESSSLYLAEQAATGRLVAVKVLNRGSPGEILVRFEQERRIVAMLRHPNIAALHDAGVSEDGRAYFVMEYVDGRPITEYCEGSGGTGGLAIEARLKLFLQLCEAVGHAHHHGVIHRDLKPLNILVTETDGEAVVKVIDFGIAKVESWTGLRATGDGQILGTIGYMAPEQIERGGSFADTRSDCYALGAVLYEMLSGTPAVPTEGVGPLTVLSRIATQEPAPMKRGGKRLRGDLNRIVAKAMHKEIEKRYQTVESLGADVERYLEGRPVSARGANPAYVFGRLALRHRRIAAVVVMLMAATVLLGVRWRGAEKDKFDLALSISKSWFEHSRTMARTIGEHARRGPYLARLDAQSLALYAQAPEHTGVVSLRADVLGALGDMELENGETGSAGRRFRQVLELREDLARRYPKDVDRMADWSVAVVRVGDALAHDGDWKAAKELFEFAMKIDEGLVKDHPKSARARTLLGWSCDRLASLANREGDSGRAEGLYLQGLEHFLVLVTLEESADSRRGLSMAYLHAGAMAGARGDVATHRRQAELAMHEAERAATNSPRDRLAGWNLMWTRRAYFDAVKGQLDSPSERAFANETVRLGLQLVQRDPGDTLGRGCLAAAVTHAAVCAEFDGDENEAVRLRTLEARMKRAAAAPARGP